MIILTLSNAEVKIVASQTCKVETLSKSDIGKLFMLKKKSIEQESIIVLDSSDKEIYHRFIKEYLNKSIRKIKTYWVRMLFTGKKIAPKKLSLEELHTLDDIGICHLSYIGKEEKKPQNWKIIQIK
ncbi:MAG: Unknown protein [uncultured Sulfurovum sp.]|uniref:Uncharacterized protein n=1 Tax=uncultured Sulfurovum sp. TaxID=269237 RepID=A0A6S6TK16_9BACT|nr:MAG: Unknown protein [uncultured Sulfurovum sp.]